MTGSEEASSPLQSQALNAQKGACQMKDFAFRCGDWVLWNVGPWSEQGWISINAIYAPKRPGVRRRSFALGWNGERFAVSKEAGRLEKFDPTAIPALRMFLGRMVKAPAKDFAA